MLPGADRPAFHRTVPWIREPSFGSTLGQRSVALRSGATLAIGPADLIHQGQPDGEKTSRFFGASFSTSKELLLEKEDDHHAGFFHFCNGIDYTQGPAGLERYVLLAIGAGSVPPEKGDVSDWEAKSRLSGDFRARSPQCADIAAERPGLISASRMAPETSAGTWAEAQSMQLLGGYENGYLGGSSRVSPDSSQLAKGQSDSSQLAGPSDSSQLHKHQSNSNKPEQNYTSSIYSNSSNWSNIYLNSNQSKSSQLEGTPLDSGDVRGRKQTIVTLCAYNAFSRSELRVRFVVAKSRRGAVSLDVSYVLYSLLLKKLHTYTRNSVQEVSAVFWTELAVLSLMRLLVSTDDASRRVCGTVLLNDMVMLHLDLRQAVSNAVGLLPKGHVLGTRQSYGSVTSAGGDFIKTAKYRNLLVDTVVRLVSLDASGKLAIETADAITRQFGADFDVVVCRVLKADLRRNHEARFLEIIGGHVAAQEALCQTALLLIEQARFLIGKKAYSVARAVASRAVLLLPLDYDAWYYLALAYVMEGRYVQAMQAINLFPVVFAKKDLSDADHVDGIYDSFAMGFMEAAVKGKGVDLRTFEEFFPPPKVWDCTRRLFDGSSSSINLRDGLKQASGASNFNEISRKEKNLLRKEKELSKKEKDGSGKDSSKGVDLGSIHKIWYDSFQYNPHLRHPIAGPFRRSPLSMATPMELSTVDLNILKISSPTSAKFLLAAQSASNPWSSIIDFDSRSTWGRTYDLITSIVALIGWDEFVYVKNEAFQTQQAQRDGGENEGGSKKDNKAEFVVSNNSLVLCKLWLQLLLLVIFEDLRVLIQTTNEDQDRSALSWQMIGLLGWSSKFNLKDSISSIVTSVMGVSSHGGFDYFGTIKMLEIYGEFAHDASPIDMFCEPYDDRILSNKLLIQKLSPKAYEAFKASLLAGHFCMDNILLCLVKLISYNLRWYGYMPDYLTTSTIMRLCEQHDPLVVLLRLQILFKTHEKKHQKKPKGSFTLRAMFAAPKADLLQAYEFVKSDTIMDYMDSMVLWIESLSGD